MSELVPEVQATNKIYSGNAPFSPGADSVRHVPELENVENVSFDELLPTETTGAAALTLAGENPVVVVPHAAVEALLPIATAACRPPATSCETASLRAWEKDPPKDMLITAGADACAPSQVIAERISEYDAEPSASSTRRQWSATFFAAPTSTPPASDAVCVP